MAVLIPLEQNNFEVGSGDIVLVTIVRHDGGASNTFTIAPGASAVATLVAPGETAPTTTVSGTTVTLANGTATDVLVTSRHVGRGYGGL